MTRIVERGIEGMFADASSKPEGYATTAAGSTITKNVPANSLAVERGQVRVIENWGKNALRKKK